MHPDMLLLAERLVIAVERLSEDVKNISTYMYDLSYSVSHFLNDKKEKEGISEVSCEAGQAVSTENEYSLQNEQTDGNSALLVNDLEHEETSIGDVAPMYFDRNEDAGVLPSLTTEQSEIEKLGKSSSECIILDNERESQFSHLKQEQENRDTYSGDPPSVTPKAVSQQETHPRIKVVMTEGPELNKTGTTYPEEFCKENNSQPHIHQHAWSCSSQMSFSHTLPPSVKIVSVNFQKQLSKNSPEHQTVVLPSLQFNTPFAAASCSTSYDTMHQEAVVDNYSLMGHVEQEVAGERQREHSDQRKGIEETYFQNERLQSGSLRSSTDKCFKCNQCGKTYTTKQKLRVHMRKHTGDRPYKCSQCEKSFTQSGDLTRHLRLHTGDRPFKCPHCGKAFTQSHNLSVHTRIHTGELPYSCTVCGECFKSSNHLNYHKRRSHEGAF